MSPLVWNHSTTTDSFPRVSGDEPRNAWDTRAWNQFSPRERG